MRRFRIHVNPCAGHFRYGFTANRQRGFALDDLDDRWLEVALADRQWPDAAAGLVELYALRPES